VPRLGSNAVRRLESEDRGSRMANSQKRCIGVTSMGSNAIMNRMNPKAAGEEEAEARVPTDLRKALAAAPKAKIQWSDLTPIARRDFISWIESAKQPETRRRRIERACSMLAEGKRRPCCYSIVSFNLYTALAATPKAKAQWSDLTSAERRDFIAWMDSAKKQPEKHKRRIEEACALLAAGKRRP
jgi:uncharacterized protein YdeI (YjbR/CyaY-like superfamily)